MSFKWSDEKINLYLEASEYTGFHKKLAQIILPYIKESSTLCDLGCGLGKIDLLLAPYLDEITCIDVNARVLEDLEKNIKLNKIDNIKTLKTDAEKISGQWDTVLLSFFGMIEDDPAKYLNLAKKNVIVILNTRNKGNLYPDKYRKASKKLTKKSLELYLKVNDLPYKYSQINVEFGQPLRSIEEARSFVKSLSANTYQEKDDKNIKRIDEDIIEDYLKKNLISLVDENYQFYLPNLKNVGVFNIPKIYPQET